LVPGATVTAAVDVLIRGLKPWPTTARAAGGIEASTRAASLRLRCFAAAHAPGGPAWVPELQGGLPPGFDPSQWAAGTDIPEPLTDRLVPTLVQGGLLPWAEDAWKWLRSQPFLIRRRLQVGIEQDHVDKGASWVRLDHALRYRSTR